MQSMADTARRLDEEEKTGEVLPLLRVVPRENKAEDAAKARPVYLFVKRAMDILLSLCGLVLLSPLFLAVAAAIKLDSKGPVIHAQTRVGKDGKLFTFYKFRSMCADAEQKLEELKAFNEKDGPIFKMHNDPRITRVGKWLRRTSVDELPQLVNILWGEMSIVGPRPPLPNEVVQYTAYQMQRLSVKGGLTCYWQISGRSDLDFDTWVELDLRYIRERSLWTDFVILIKTFPALVRNVNGGAY